MESAATAVIGIVLYCIFFYYTVMQSVKANGVPSLGRPGIPALVDQAESSLFQSIHLKPAHGLCHLLPPTVQHAYGLRPRSHNYDLPGRQNLYTTCIN